MKKFTTTKICVFITSLLMAALIIVHLSYAQDSDTYRNFGQNFSEKFNHPRYKMPEGPYKPNLASLSGVTVAPKWFRDAKFGIYTTWGVYSVPAYENEWYPTYMYQKGSKVNKYHRKTYGSPLKFGYPDFVPMFKAEKFDADQWAKLFKEAGARFAGPVAEHHDGFAMWDSDWTPWNAADMGPHQDIVGELKKAIRAKNMHFITTFHHAHNDLWKSKGGEWLGYYSYAMKNYPSLFSDPERAIMYGYMSRNIFLQMWQGELREVINKYQPDIIWFDSWLDEIPKDMRYKFLTYYYNKAVEFNKNVVVTYKQEDLSPKVAVKDFERGRANELKKTPWLTDDSIADNSWGYTTDLKLKNSAQIVHNLIDIVSKNGQLLLSIAPKADGTIPDNQKQILRNIGDWLDQNGEAIYGTRPWKTFGEGPNRLKKGGEFVNDISYSSKDIRYTRKGDIIYAIVLGWPGKNTKILLSAWAKNNSSGTKKIENVSLLGCSVNIQWKRQKQGLQIMTPSVAPNKKAIVFKIQTQQ